MIAGATYMILFSWGAAEKARGKVNRNDLISTLKKAADLIRRSLDYKAMLVFFFTNR